jgi:hypothetical protein
VTPDHLDEDRLILSRPAPVERVQAEPAEPNVTFLTALGAPFEHRGFPRFVTGVVVLILIAIPLAFAAAVVSSGLPWTPSDLLPFVAWVLVIEAGGIAALWRGRRR